MIFIRILSVFVVAVVLGGTRQRLPGGSGCLKQRSVLNVYQCVLFALAFTFGEALQKVRTDPVRWHVLSNKGGIRSFFISARNSAVGLWYRES
jgi:hypothetical protein